jgi:hypothetical protein
MKTRIAFAIMCALILSTNAVPEIEKLAVTSDGQMCFYSWPKLPDINGWHHDRDSSLVYGANAMAPDGLTFSDAETVMYARAEYKPGMPETKSVEMVIANDRKRFLETNPGIAISEVSPLTTADGQKLRSFAFFPKEKGNWERVSYGEEGDFFVIFVLSSRTKAGYDKELHAYEQLIGRYKEKP